MIEMNYIIKICDLPEFPFLQGFLHKYWKANHFERIR
jgi:hypothetical protein